MTFASDDRPPEIPVRNLRPHSSLLVEMIVLMLISLGGGALTVAGARIVSLGGSGVNVGWAMVAVGAAVALGLAFVGVRRHLLRARIEELGDNGVLRTYTVSSRMDDGTVYASVPDRPARRWTSDRSGPLLILGDPPQVLGVVAVGRDAPPIPVSANGYPFAETAGLRDLFAAAEQLGASNAGDLAAPTESPDTRPEPLDDDRLTPSEVARPRLPVLRGPDTAVARRLRWRVLAFALLIGFLVIVNVSKPYEGILGPLIPIVLAICVFLWTRKKWVGITGTVAVDDWGIVVRYAGGRKHVPWDRLVWVGIGAVQSGGVATGIGGLAMEAAISLSSSGAASDTPQLGDDPLVARLVGLGMGVRPVLPEVHLVVDGAPGHVQLRGTHDWHIAHAIAAEALARGIDVEFG